MTASCPAGSRTLGNLFFKLLGDKYSTDNNTNEFANIFCTFILKSIGGDYRSTNSIVVDSLKGPYANLCMHSMNHTSQSRLVSVIHLTVQWTIHMHVTMCFIRQTMALAKKHYAWIFLGSAETSLHPCSSCRSNVLHVCDRTVTQSLGAVEYEGLWMCQWSLQWEHHVPNIQSICSLHSE